MTLGNHMNSDLHGAYRDWLRGLGFRLFVSLNLNAALSPNRGFVRVYQAGQTAGTVTCQIAPPSRRVPTTWSITTPQVRDLLKRLDAAVHTRLIHRHFDRLPARRRLLWVAAIESPDLNPHAHLLWRVPMGQLWPFRSLWGNMHREDIWQGLVGSGDSHIRIVEDTEVAADYLIKQGPYRWDRLVVSSEFWPDWCRLT